MANKKRITKASKRRLAFFGTISLFVILYFVVISVTNVVRIHNLNKSYDDLKLQLIELETEEKKLKTEIAKLQDPDYLARYAREHYSYSKEGEYVIKMDKKESDTSNDLQTYKIDPMYLYIAGGIILFIIFISILKKIINKKKK